MDGKLICFTGRCGYQAMPSEGDPIARAAYDEIVDAYAEDGRMSAYRSELEFPATSSPIPNIEEK